MATPDKNQGLQPDRASSSELSSESLTGRNGEELDQPVLIEEDLDETDLDDEDLDEEDLDDEDWEEIEETEEGSARGSSGDEEKDIAV